MRQSCAIQGDTGTILLVARERGLMRLYIPLTSTDDSTKRVDRSNINLDMLKATAQKIFHPYTFDFKICDCTLPHQFQTRNNAKIFSFI